MSYLVPGLRTEREKQAVEHVAELMAEADVQREEDELDREDYAEEEKRFDPATGAESPSTKRIIAEWASGRDGRGDDDLDEGAEDEQALAGLPGAEPDIGDQERTAKAIASVRQRLTSGIVTYSEDGTTEEAVASPDNYSDWDDAARESLPAEPEPMQQPAAAQPAAVEGEADDGFGPRGPYSGPQRASSPPSFTP